MIDHIHWYISRSIFLREIATKITGGGYKKRDGGKSEVRELNYLAELGAPPPGASSIESWHRCRWLFSRSRGHRASQSPCSSLARQSTGRRRGTEREWGPSCFQRTWESVQSAAPSECLKLPYPLGPFILSPWTLDCSDLILTVFTKHVGDGVEG